MDFIGMLEKSLSATDFARMKTWLAGLEPDQQATMMQFIVDRETRAPALNELAPDFELPRLDRDELVRLSSFRGVAPVALIFGSFT